MSLTLTNIPAIMRANGWPEGAALLETWFSRRAAVRPAYGAPVTNVIRMDWVLSFPRAKKVYADMFRRRVWLEPKVRDKIIGLLMKKNSLCSTAQVKFGDLSRSVEAVDADRVHVELVTSSPPLDGMLAALGDFSLAMAVAGTVDPIWTLKEDKQKKKKTEKILTGFRVTLTEVGVYVRDTFDFNGPQLLGFWDDADNSVSWWDASSGELVTNGDFRSWRASNQRGGDFLVYSDVRRTSLSRSDSNSFTIPVTGWSSR